MIWIVALTRQNNHGPAQPPPDDPNKAGGAMGGAGIPVDRGAQVPLWRPRSA